MATLDTRFVGNWKEEESGFRATFSNNQKRVNVTFADIERQVIIGTYRSSHNKGAWSTYLDGAKEVIELAPDEAEGCYLRFHYRFINDDKTVEFLSNSGKAVMVLQKEILKSSKED